MAGVAELELNRRGAMQHADVTSVQPTTAESALASATNGTGGHIVGLRVRKKELSLSGYNSERK